MNSLMLLLFSNYFITSKDIKLIRRTVEDNVFDTKEEVFLPFIFKMSIGTPPKEFDFIIDTSSYPLWLPNKEMSKYFIRVFKENESSTFSAIDSKNKIHITTYDSIIVATEVTDKLSNPFESDKASSGKVMTNDFHWMLSEFGIFKYYSSDGSVGFARRYPNKNFPLDKKDNGIRYSFVDYLLKEGVIKEKVFSITRSSEKSGTLSIGDYDKKLFDTKDKGKCLCAKEGDSFYIASIDTLWNCRVINITLGANVVSSSFYSMVFETNAEFVYAPLENGLRMFANITQNIWNEAKCEIQKIMSSNLFICGLFDYFARDAFTLIIEIDGGYKLSAYSKDLWKKFNKTHLQFKVIAIDQINYWKVGEPMLKYENMLFQYGEGSITLVKFTEFNLVLYLIIGGVGLFVIISIVLGVLLYIKFRKAPEKKRDESVIVNDVAKESLTGFIDSEN